MIDSLFGSKTRVKLLGLFMNNPERSFYVREITRNINEQINSVRRELANLVEIGVVTRDSVDNRLYYKADINFRYYHALREMFANETDVVRGPKVEVDAWAAKFAAIKGIKEVIFAGALVYESASPLDLIVAGDPTMDQSKVRALIKALEKGLDTQLNYSILDTEDLYYRLSIRDRFVLDVLESKHTVVLDDTGMLVDYPGVNDAKDETVND